MDSKAVAEEAMRKFKLQGAGPRELKFWGMKVFNPTSNASDCWYETRYTVVKLRDDENCKVFDRSVRWTDLLPVPRLSSLCTIPHWHARSVRIGSVDVMAKWG